MCGFHAGLVPWVTEFWFFITSRLAIVTLYMLTYSWTHCVFRSAQISALTQVHAEDGVTVCFRLDNPPLLGSRGTVSSREQFPGQYYFLLESLTDNPLVICSSVFKRIFNNGHPSIDPYQGPEIRTNPCPLCWGQVATEVLWRLWVPGPFVPIQIQMLAQC